MGSGAVKFSLWAIVFLIAAIEAQGAVLFAIPSQQAAPEIGGVIEVQVRVENAKRLMGYEFDFAFDNRALKVTRISEGPFLKSDGAITFFAVPRVEGCNRTGVIENIGEIRLMSLTGIDGEGVLVTIIFEVLSENNSPFELREAKVQTESGNLWKDFVPTDIEAGQDITFDAVNAGISSDRIVSYEWNFGDGEKAKGEKVTHTYEKGKLLFSVDSDLQHDLDEGRVPDALRQTFETRNIPLSQDAAVWPEEFGSKWAITDRYGMKSYTVKKENDDLSIYGVYEVTLRIATGQGCSTTYIVSGNPPTADSQSVATNLNVPVGIMLTGSDPDGDVLTFRITNPPSSGSLAGTAPELTYTPNPDFYGIDGFTFIVYDGSVESEPAIVTINVNHPPVVGEIPDQMVQLGEMFEVIRLDSYVSDPDNADSEITWTYSGNKELSIAIGEDRVATITVTAPDWTGTETVTFTATDPNGLAVSNEVKFTVEPGFILGDVNNDGAVRSNDAILVLRMAADLMEPTDYERRAADVNQDGNIRSNDAILVLRIAAGLAAPGTDHTVVAVRRPITISLPEIHGIAGETVIVPLEADNLASLAGGDIRISYDPSVLRAVDLRFSDVDASDESLGMIAVSNLDKPGNIVVAFAGNTKPSSSEIVRIRFRILRDNVSPLTFGSLKLYGPDARPLSAIGLNSKFVSWAVPPENPALFQNYPNPFNPETWIPYQLKGRSNVTIRVYSVLGELVCELKLGSKRAGQYVSRDRAAYWDGRDESGFPVASGVYFYSIHAGEFTATKKMILAK